MSGRSARTIRNFSLEVSPDLVLLDMGKVDFHDFWKYWKLTSSPNTSKINLGLQIGPRIFSKARVPSQELSNKLIFTKYTK